MNTDKKGLFVVSLVMSLTATGLSLFVQRPGYCTSTVRGWPFDVVRIPCMCERNIEGLWIPQPLWLIVNVALFFLAATCLIVLGKMVRRTASTGQVSGER